MELIREMYTSNPNFFIENKNKHPLTILLEVLKIFRDKIKNKNDSNDSNDSNNSNDSDNKK